MDLARALAGNAEISAAATPAQRVDGLFRRVLGRHPTRSESASALRFVEAAGSDAQTDKSLTPWEQFAQVLLISNEAVFLD
jgi:hypothetical protein